MKEDPEHSFASVLHAEQVVINGGTMNQSVVHVQNNYVQSSLTDEFDGTSNSQNLQAGSTHSGLDEFVQLKSLVSDDAFHDSIKYSDFMKRDLTQLEEDLVQDAIAWSSQPSTSRESRILHIDIPNGETIVAQHIAERLEQQNTFLGSFFFRGQDHIQQGAEHVFVATMVYQLSASVPHTRRLVLQAMHADPFVFRRDLRKQLRRLVVQPMSAIPTTGERLDVDTGIFVIHVSPDLLDSSSVRNIIQAMEDAFHEESDCHARFIILHARGGPQAVLHTHLAVTLKGIVDPASFFEATYVIDFLERALPQSDKAHRLIFFLSQSVSILAKRTHYLLTNYSFSYPNA